MPVEICTIGGYSYTGGNSVAVKVDDEVVILDMGLHMENYIRYTEDRDDLKSEVTYKQLQKINAVPNYNHIKDWREKVIAICPSHAHLDHAGAIPFAASLFPNASIICTPYTMEVLKGIFYDERITLPNKLITLDLNATRVISSKITVEFIYVTHSIPHTAIVVLHTPYGKIMYANDYKFDRQPVLGAKPNFKRLEELGKEGIDLLIIECLYAHEHRKMPSESVAKEMLKEVMLGRHTEGKGMIVTTFSSHIARLKSIIEFGKKLNRKIVFLGRSLSKYVAAAENIGLVQFSSDVKIVKYRDKIEQTLTKIMKDGKEKYLVVCTGHQGEPQAILSRIVKKQLPYSLASGDIVVFSCSVIPVPLNQENRERLEKELCAYDVRIFRDVHVSGHAAREDHRDLIELVKPRKIVPAHAGPEKAEMLADLAKQIGFDVVQVMQDGQRLRL